MADIAGVIIGGAIALAGSFGAKFWDDRGQSRSLRAAFRAEIAVILRTAENRGLEALFRRYVAHWDETGTELPVILWGFDQIVADPILSANTGKIGSLGSDVAEDVGLFYGHTNAVRIDMLAFKNGSLGNLVPERRVDVVRNALATWDEAKIIGERLRRTL